MEDPDTEFPMTGIGTPTFDETIPAFLEKWSIPGAGISVAVGERLMVARGYGLQNRNTDEAVQPDTRFRIASLSKPFTSAAVMLLVEEGMLELDEPAFDLLPDLHPRSGISPDSRLGEITIRHLLTHTAGWDRDTTFDPMFYSWVIATTMGEPLPAGPEAIIEYMMGRPLDFAPGTRYVYSNFGYCVLGRIIEAVSGMDYETFVRMRVLQPVGADGMHVGHSLLTDREPLETHYYDYSGAPPASSVFTSQGSVQVQRPYGGFYIEAMDSHGGWIASAPELLRFMTSMDGRSNRPDLVTADSRESLLARDDRFWSSGYHYGLGWEVTPNSFSHTGALPGTATYMGCRSSGYCIAAVLNSWPQPQSGDFFGEFTQLLWKAADNMPVDGSVDLFDSY